MKISSSDYYFFACGHLNHFVVLEGEMAEGGDDCAAGTTISPGAARRAIIAPEFERLQAAGILGTISRRSVYSGECDFIPTSFSSLATRIELAASCKAVKHAEFPAAVEPERYIYIWEWRDGTI